MGHSKGEHFGVNNQKGMGMKMFAATISADECESSEMMCLSVGGDGEGYIARMGPDLDASASDGNMKFAMSCIHMNFETRTISSLDKPSLMTIFDSTPFCADDHYAARPKRLVDFFGGSLDMFDKNAWREMTAFVYWNISSTFAPTRRATWSSWTSASST
jgi:hypothetical protein